MSLFFKFNILERVKVAFSYNVPLIGLFSLVLLDV